MRQSDLDPFISRTWWAVLLGVAIRENYMPTLSTCHVSAFVVVRHQNYHSNIALPSSVYNTQTVSLSKRLFEKESNDIDCPSLNKHVCVLSESEAIKILRAFPRSTKKRSIEMTAVNESDRPTSLESCSSAQDVLRVISCAVSTQQRHMNNGLLHVETIVNEISPNIAAAALRRLVSPPFLPVSFSTTKKGIQYLNKQQRHNYNEITEVEKELYIHLTTLLQKRLHVCIKNQLESISSVADDDPDDIPILLAKNSTFGISPDNSQAAAVLNWYALADLLFSISVLSNLLIYQSTKQNAPSRNVYLQTFVNAQSVSNKHSVDIFDVAIEYLSYNNRITSSFVRCIGAKRIVRDVLSPLIVVETSRRQISYLKSNPLQESDEGEMDLWYDEPSMLDKSRIIQVASSYLSLPHSLEMLNCADLSMALWCFVQTYAEPNIDELFWSNESVGTMQINEVVVNLVRSFMKRIRKVAVHSMGSGKDIAQAIWSVDRLHVLIKQQYLPDNRDQIWDYKIEELNLPSNIVFPGESMASKGRVRTGSTKTEETGYVDEGNSLIEKMHKEAVVMYFTLTTHLLKPSSSASTYCKLKSLTLEQLADILQAGLSMKMPRSDLSALITTTIYILTSEAVTMSRNIINQCNSCAQIARMLWSLQRLRVGSEQFCDATSHLDQSLQAECVQLLGERFLALVHEHQQCNPKSLVIALRSSVMMYPGKSISTDAILEAALILMNSDEPELEHYPLSPFVLECNDYEISNIMFAFALAKHFDKDIYLKLTAQMQEVEVIENCSASSASRAMWSCAVLLQQLPSEADESFLHERQVDFYHQLSGILLTSHLSPTDCSSAMWAMAKCGYALDKGCFDFLAQKLAEMLEISSTRLVAQALWSCAKMIRYEKQSPDKSPPYMESVVKFIRHLIDNSDQMTPIQISQTIWSIGSLRILDPTIAEQLSVVALRNAAHCNSQEIANIVWGFSKVNYKNLDVISELVRYITESIVLREECSSQEASNILYALGKLQIRDVHVYESLSCILMNHLHDASSQAIANALWAHDVVGIEPPMALMGCWAKERLGMNDIQLE